MIQQTEQHRYANAVKARDNGMKRAKDHANRKKADWSVKAAAFLASFARCNRQFLAEDVITAANESVRFPNPPDARSWGSVFVAAHRDGIIKRTGRYRPAKSSHLSPKPLWASKLAGA